MNGKPRRLRLLAIASIIGLGSALGMAAAPAGAATAQHVSTPFSAHTRNAPRINPVPAPIVNFHSGLCLGTKGGLDNVPAVQWNCNGNQDQQWAMGGTNSAGYYQIVNDHHQCLGVAGGSTASGAQVVGWNCLGTSHPDQYWKINFGFSCSTANSPLYYPIFNYKSNRVLGVGGNSTAVGAAVVIWDFQIMCNNQYWLPGADSFDVTAAAQTAAK